MTRRERERRGLTYTNKKGRKRRKEAEERDREVEHNDSGDSLDDEPCTKCGKEKYTTANPILMCDGCNTLLHLKCIPVRKRPSIAEVEDEGKEWLCENCEEQYEVEELLDSKVVRRSKQYLVKWVGHDEPTWEKASNINQELIAGFEASCQMPNTANRRRSARTSRA